MRTPLFILLFLLLLGGTIFTPGQSKAQELTAEQVDPRILATIFSGHETLHYEDSWSGGMKIGDIYLQILPEKERPNAYRISAKVTDYGPLKLMYPVDDVFSCIVEGEMKLPYRYEVLQREGLSGKVTKRVTWYDQVLKYAKYQKNDNEPKRFEMGGKSYNEFAAFIITRALVLKDGTDVIVPTFADEKRRLVAVNLIKREYRPTIFDKKQLTLKIQPKLNFKGLYEKSGDTILWVTDDQCRVPVEIRSHITVGSLVAKLADYENPACPSLVVQKKKQ